MMEEVNGKQPVAAIEMINAADDGTLSRIVSDVRDALAPVSSAGQPAPERFRLWAMALENSPGEIWK